MTYDVVVLAGGRGSRFGADKVQAQLDGRTLLDHVLDATAEASRVIVVGPQRLSDHKVTWVREDPPFSGPVNGLRAALEQVTERIVILLGADMPYVGRAIPALLQALGNHDAVVLVDESRREQPLASAWSDTALRTACAGNGKRLVGLFDGLDVVRLVDRWDAALDVDTVDDLDRIGGSLA
jgi:molybdopterin-guanine dinucleotide biosynthesis protein A